MNWLASWGWIMSGEWVRVVPENCPKVPTHNLGIPSAKFPYLTADGSRSWAVCRWDTPEGKVIRPLSLWRDESGTLYWHWGFPPAPRALYNLPGLLNDKPALVVEGEKAAEAAQRLFPDWAVTTSGSSTSSGVADWGPLRGRKVVCWPDNDMAGRDYAQKVAGILNGQVVSLPKEFPEKWDLADPQPNGWDVARLRSLLESSKPIESIHPPRSIQSWSVGELLDMPRTTPRWIWEGWLPRAKVGMIVAVGDHGKTALGLQLGAAVATGRPFLGFPTNHKPLGVLVVSFEDDAQEDLGPRLRLVLEAMGDLSPEESKSLRSGFRIANPTWTGPDVLFEGLRPDLERELQSMKDSGVEPGIVILETLQAITNGDENSVDATRKLWNQARAIAKGFDVSVAISHHLKKETNTGKNRAGLYEKLESDRIRGSSANEGAARFVLQLASIRPDEAERGGLDPLKAQAKGYAILRASKIKAEKPPYLFLERIEAGEPGSHCWKKHPEGERIIADLLQSANARDKVTQDEALLVAIWETRHDPDRESVKAQAFPNLDPKKAETALKNGLQSLRSKGWVAKGRGSLQITSEGIEKALQMASRMDPSQDENSVLERIFEDQPNSSDDLSDPSIPESGSYGWMEGVPKGVYPSIRESEVVL